jgi:hypothetical protein
MIPGWPTPAEAASLRFLLPVGGLGTRLVAAALLFATGVFLWSAMPLPAAFLGLFVILAGHLVIWVRTQTTAPGGATPAHEDVWAPVEEDWLERVQELEDRGARWDVTPWDVTNGKGCLTLLGFVFLLFGIGLALTWLPGGEWMLRFFAGAAVLVVPLWFNGVRTTWNPSELRKKGQALEVAREAARKLAAGDFELVPTLAIREGRRGKYPVDARLMLRPAREDETGFLGVQVQVAMNNVRGTDYPYLYAVVLGKEPFQLPKVSGRQKLNRVDTVFEKGEGQGVRYIVVRQHADTKGGWHTQEDDIQGLVATAIDAARRAWRDNGGAPSA